MQCRLPKKIGTPGGGTSYPEGAFIPVTKFTAGKSYALVAKIDGVYRYINTTAFNNYTMNATEVSVTPGGGYVTFGSEPALFKAEASGDGFTLGNGSNFLHGTSSGGTALRVGTTSAVWKVDTSETGGFASGKYLPKEVSSSVWLKNTANNYDWSIKYESNNRSFGYDRAGRDNTYSTGFVSFILYEKYEGGSGGSGGDSGGGGGDSGGGNGITYVEYISVSQGQYIDTKFTPKGSTRVVFECECTETPSYDTLFGATNSNNYTATNAYWLEIESTTNATYIYFGYNTSISGTFTAGTRISVDTNKNTCTINGKSATTTSSSSSSTCSLYLFNVHNSAGSSINTDRNFVGKFYSCQIYDNGTLKYDYKPCLDTDGIACLYDEVSQSYVYNSGTGTFTAGAII